MTLIGEFGLELNFVQLRPGNELEIEGELATLFSQSQRYKCLGKFDLLIVSQINTVSELQKRGNNLGSINPDILQVNRLLCFALNNPLSLPISDEAFVDHVKYPICGVCFLKFQPYAIHELGSSLYVAVNSYLRSGSIQLESAKLAVYGSIGWNEIVVLIFDRHYAKILRDVLRLGDLKASHIGLSKNRNIFVDSFTVPCVSYEVLRKIASNQSTEVLDDMKLQDIALQLDISCKSGSSNMLVANTAKKYFATDVETALGKKDITLCSGIPFKSFLGALMKFRKDMRNHIFATSTSVTLKDMPELEMPTDEWPRMKYVKVDISTKLAELTLNDTSLFRSLEDCYAGLNSCLGDSVLCEAFADLVPFAEHLTRRGKEDLYEPIQKLQISGVIEAFAKAYKQRLLGSNLTFFEISELVLTYHGGMHRVLQASNLIPWWLLKRFGEQWTGFTVFGLKGQYLRYSYGIVNLPYECLFDPTKWFGMMHELGHEFYHKKKMLYQDPILKYLSQRGIKTIRPPEELDLEQREEVRIIEESCADFFDFIYGFREDWDLYVDNVLVYIFTNWPDRSLDFLRRSFAIYLYFKSKNSSETLPAPNRKRYTEVLKSLLNELAKRSEIRSILEKQGMLESNQDSMKQVIGYMFLQRDVLKWAIEFMAESFRAASAPSIPTSQTESFFETVRNGGVQDDVPDPVDALLRMIKCQDKELKMVFAFLLSFSTCFARIALPEKLPYFVLTAVSSQQ